LPSAVPPVVFDSSSACPQQFLLLPSTASPLALSNPPTCHQHSLLWPSALPPLPFAIPSLAFSNPFTCLQQSLHLPSTVLLLPSAVPALVFSSPRYLQTSICLQQPLHMPFTLPPLAYNGLSTCLQQSLARGPHGHTASYRCMSHVNAAHKAVAISSTPLKLITKAAGCLAHLMRLPCRYARFVSLHALYTNH